MDGENIETEIIEEHVVVEEPVVEHIVLEEQEEHVVEEQVEEHIVLEEQIVHEEPVAEEETVFEEHIVEEIIMETQTIEEHIVDELVMETQTVQEFVIETPVVEEPVKSIPKIVFIVPYRDRSQHKEFFSNHMKTILEDYEQSDYEMYYVHQCDVREFNRGAMKNIGFLTIKEKYPEDYKNITFVFNDVDIMPRNKNALDYETTVGFVKHFYGYVFTLGGIVSIKGEDFERVGGFPNFWAWGYEDNLLQLRVLNSGLSIDRRIFFPILDANIIHLNEGMSRIINKNEFNKYVGNTSEGWHTIKNITKSMDEQSGFINVTSFDTGSEPVSNENKLYDIRNGNKPYTPTPIFKASRRRSMMGMHM